MVGVHGGERGDWLAAQHDDEATRFLHGFVVLDVDGLGPTRFVHGSPRSDEECVTPETPDERVREFMAGVPERVVVTAHVRWAVLGPDVELRRTDYDHDATAELFRASGIPGADEDVEMLLSPIMRADIIADAESRVFAG